jgi:hypothetical protein
MNIRSFVGDAIAYFGKAQMKAVINGDVTKGIEMLQGGLSAQCRKMGISNLPHISLRQDLSR